ncbi:MAG: hypothetical protein KDD92_07915 [Caldilineaceae bacterium]|nr:hypothetical protein [Caldilineaceae bacterium]
MGLDSPALLLGFLLATALAGVFHFWGGRSLGELFFFWAAACIGFAVGQALGQLIRIPVLQIGQLHVVEGSLGALFALIVARAWRQAD